MDVRLIHETPRDVRTWLRWSHLSLAVQRHWLLSRTLNRIKGELQVVLDRIEAAGHAGNAKDIQIASDLMDNIRDAITDYQVRGDPKPFLQPSHSGNRSRLCTSRPCAIRMFD